MYIIKQRSTARPGEQEVKRLAKENEAIQFIQDKLQQDLFYKIKNIYSLYEGDDLLREFTPEDAVAAQQSAIQDEDSEGQSGAGKSSSQSFKPTPFNTSPRIGPQSYIRDEDPEDREK